MDADLDLLLTTVFVTADDLLPERAGNARRRVTDAEVVTLCVTQSIMGIPSDRRFLKVAAGNHSRKLNGINNTCSRPQTMKFWAIPRIVHNPPDSRPFTQQPHA